MKLKTDIYYKEQEEICNRILAILELDHRNSFVRSEIDNNEEKQQQIMDMKPEIKKYFACAKMAAFKPNFYVKRPYMSIVRGVLHTQGYNIVSKRFLATIDRNVLRQSIRYVITRNEEIEEIEEID